MIPVVMVVSCWKNGERMQAIRKTWATMSPFPVKFVVGNDGNCYLSNTDDIVCVDTPDDYIGLPRKIHAAVKRLRQEHDYILKVDDDMFVAADRLVVPAQEYVGRVVRNSSDHPWYCHGGAGYWLGPNAATAVASADPKGFLSEDAFIAWAVTNAGIGLTSTPRHNVLVGPDRWKMLPRASNDFVTCGEFDVWELKRAFDLYKKDNREDALTADEYKKHIQANADRV